MRDIGVDLHKTNFQCCYLSDGKNEFRRYWLSDLEEFKKGLNRTDRVAVETTREQSMVLESDKGFGI